MPRDSALAEGRTTTGSTPLAVFWGAHAGQQALPGLLLPPGKALPVPPAADRSTWDLESGSADRRTRAEITARAEQDRGQPWPHPRAALWADYVRTGDRSAYEREIYRRTERLSRAVIAALSTQGAEWLDEVSDGVTLLCEQSSWCWSAHDDAFRRKGWLVPDPDEPFLDLGAGEIAAQFAWIDHLLGSDLDQHMPGLRHRMRREVRHRVLDPYMERRDWHWLNRRPPNNWMPWVCGNVLLAALVFLDGEGQDDLRAAIVAQTIADVDRYVASLPEDGAIDEGASYWWAGAGRLLEMLDLLRYATGGFLDAGDLPILRQLIAFLYRMNLGNGWCLAVADGKPRPSSQHPWDVPHRWALRVGDEDARRYAAAHRRPSEAAGDETRGLGRLIRRVTDNAWCAADPSDPVEPEGSVWLPSVQILLTHARSSGRRVSLAVKGGHNAESHNHNDIGEIVVALDGVPAIVDPGRPTYTRQTFSDRRYDLWPMQSLWHNVPVIRGTSQSAGREFTARDARLLDEGTGLALDIGGAYDRPDIKHWFRSATLNDHGVEVVDTWDLAPATAARATRWHWILAGDVSVEQHGRAIVEPIEGAGALELTWDPSLSAEVEVQQLEDQMLRDIWGERLTRLVIGLPIGAGAEQGSATFRVTVCR